MPSSQISGSHYAAMVIALLAVMVGGAAGAHGQTASQTSATGAENEAAFQLKAASNLIVVRVVVRDEHGKAVENLKKEDFKLFDRGKEQSIVQFEMESSVAPPSVPIAAPAPRQAALPPAPTLPGKFIAFYFDALNTSDGNLMQARDAADHYLAAHLQPQDRAAIFTSEQMLSDFTSDPKQIHEALFQLHASARTLTRVHYCPDLSDYQALRITENDDEAMAVALDDETHCRGNGNGQAHFDNSHALTVEKEGIRGLARNIVSQAQTQTRSNLEQLEQVLKYITQMPGQRTIIVVSPGFLSQSEQYQLDRIIDHALRSQVVVSALDPKGLTVLMRQFDASRSYIPPNPRTLEAANRLDSMRESDSANVLAELAQGTGGEFFRDNNDLMGGFGALAGSPTYYTLAFAPKDMKLDGKFHALKVTLTEKEKGFSIQARRGYFAAKNEADATAEAKEEQDTSDSADQAQEGEQMREAIFSTATLQQLPVNLGARAKTADGQGEMRELLLYAHLDANSLHFRKEGEHNLNTVIFAFAIFDKKDNLVNTQQRRARMNIPDADLPNLRKGGVDVNATFQLKPGVYRIREVVTDSEDHHMTALSRKVHIP